MNREMNGGPPYQDATREDDMDSEAIAQMRQEKYNATVHGLNKVHSDLMMIRIRPDKPIIPHKAGQYTLLGLGNWEPRLPETM